MARAKTLKNQYGNALKPGVFGALIPAVTILAVVQMNAVRARKDV
jgi:hypothetical protein